MPKQNAATDNAPPVRDEPIVRERPELAQPVAYIAGRYVYGQGRDDHHVASGRRGLLGRHRGTRAA